ncbi:unnamed protein product [Leptosia nina]|uniref:Ribonuclease P protein subunit p29 n=1 Tax=Leptosia nina TaxID=320188 RepID=A0AAV1IXB9_9NEOP
MESMDVDTQSDPSQSIIQFLEANIPKSDIPNIRNELKKDLLLGKTKSRVKKQKKRKPKLFTRKEKRNLGFYNIPRESVKYKDVEPMHLYWVEYINQILELDKPIPNETSKRWEQFTQSLYKADFHGSMLHVVRSKCPSYIDKKGICIMDTKNTFKIVSPNNIITTIPKKESVFSLCVKNVKITLFGKHLNIRPAERSHKKFKSLVHPDLY